MPQATAGDRPLTTPDPGERGQPRPAPPGRPGSRRGLVLVLGVLIALGPLSIDLYLPALPAIRDGLATTPAMVQLTLTSVLVGMGLGQLLVGPLSDLLGRRAPMLAGLVLYTAASLLCGLAPGIGVLVAARVGQGLGAAAAAVTATAVLRDLSSGTALARLFSRLLLLPLAAPVLAPSLGSLVLGWAPWRWLFGLLAGLGLGLVVVAAVGVDETLPPARRRPARVAAILGAYRTLLRDGRFVGLVLVTGLAMAALITYVAGSSFVFQEEFGMDERQFGLLFGVGGLALLAASQLNVWLLRRHSSKRILLGALVTGAAAGAVMVGSGLTGAAGPAGVLVPLWVLVAAVGLTFPNAPALALSRHGEIAGTAASLLGAVQFGLAGLAAPVVGMLGGGTVAMAAVSAAAMLAAAGVMLGAGRRTGGRPSART